MANIDFNQYAYGRGSPAAILWKTNMAEMLRKYLSGEPIYVGFDTKREPKRAGSIGRLVISNVQDLLHGEYEYQRRRYSQKLEVIEEIPSNVKEDHFDRIQINGHVVWDGRKNKIQFTGWGAYWISDRKPEDGTVWAYEKPEDVPQVEARDKLDREIKVGDFISYILYHFGNGHNAAGIFYGKVTKIDKDGTVYAKNIKLKDDDYVAEKRIKDNSLIVIMSKDLMDKLMLARLSIL